MYYKSALTGALVISNYYWDSRSVVPPFPLVLPWESLLSGNPHVATLTAATAATVTLDGEWEYVRVIPLTTDHVYITVDGSTPVSEADGAILAPNRMQTTVKVPYTAGSTAVKLISATAGKVYLEGVNAN